MSDKPLFPAWIQGAFAGVVASVLVSAWYAEEDEAVVQDKLAGRPPIVVVDIGAMAARELQSGARDAAKVHLALDKTARLIEEFRDAGYLVLDAKYVLEAPKELYLKEMVEKLQVSAEGKENGRGSGD